jgi:hypothetical protein
VIWLHLAQVRARQDDAQELAQNAAHIDRAKWPGPVVDLHLGPVATTQSAIHRSFPRTVRRNPTAPATFNSTSPLLIWRKASVPEAEEHLRAAVELCLPGGIERLAARAELDGMASR